VKFWSAFTDVPQWLLALIALAIVLSLNLVSVKVFGEMEFWFAIIKVVALVAFLLIGALFLAFSFPTDAGPTGISVLSDNGGFFPSGLIPTVLVVQGVVFAYAGIELVGTAAGETADPKRIMPRAVNTVVLRIAVFYVGSVLLLSLLLPHTEYKAGESPFVTFFSSIGSPATGAVAGNIMNFVVLTAALSSLNAGLYSTGRILRSMSVNGSAPRFTGVMNKGGVPYGGILLTGAITLLGVGLNAVVPEQAFEIVLNISALGIVTGWGMIILCQMQLQRWAKQGRAERPSFRLFGAPFTAYLTLAFLVTVVALMAIDWPVGTITVGSLVIVIPLLVAGWYLSRDRILEIARAREGYTGAFPVVAERPGIDGRRRDDGAPGA
jgi:L-asparagine permease